MSKQFYKMRIVPDSKGLCVITEIFISIHETPCFHYCVRAYDKGSFNSVLMNKNETRLQYAKRENIKIYRIHKSGSRIAFETEKQAFEHLQFLKRKQIRHMERDIEFNRAFLKACKGVGDLLPDYSSDICRHRTVPDTEDLVSRYYFFD